MARLIWKFPIVNATTMDLGMPAKIIKVDQQAGVPYVWVEHDPEEGIPANWEFLVVNTGDTIPEGYHWIGSWYESLTDASKHAYAITTNPGQAPINYFEK